MWLENKSFRVVGLTSSVRTNLTFFTQQLKQTKTQGKIDKIYMLSIGEMLSGRVSWTKIYFVKKYQKCWRSELEV